MVRVKNCHAAMCGMKHNWSVTLLLLLLYLVSHVTGLFLLGNEMTIVERDGERTPQYGDTSIGERPDVQGASTILYIGVGVGIGTVLLLILIRFKQYNLWKFWFFTAAFLAISLAFGAVLPTTIAFGLGFALALGKILSRNTLIHNVSEVFMYAGIAVFFAPLLTVWWGVVLLLAFSLYDAYAVWKSEHMVEMAKFQSKSVFAGLNLPYTDQGIQGSTRAMAEEAGVEHEPVHEKEGPQTAILGGGDIAIPLLFAAAVVGYAVERGASHTAAFLSGLIVSIASAVSLFLLFYYGKDDQFYPAMPFITVGCLVGFGLVLVIA